MQVLTHRSLSDVNSGVLWGTLGRKGPQAGSRVASGRFGLPACGAGVGGPAAGLPPLTVTFHGLLGSLKLARPRSPALGLLRVCVGRGGWGCV